ncbi:MAG: hypothetical protein KF716_13305 [Anaerolineae bacterium]|nr:hypothetical protein [Anaerolineae bacterium]
MAAILAQAERDPVLDQLITDMQIAIETELTRPSGLIPRNTMLTPNNRIFKIPIRIPFLALPHHLTSVVAMIALVILGVLLGKAYPNLPPAFSSGQQSATPMVTPPAAQEKIGVQNVGKLALVAEIPDTRLTQLAFSADGAYIAYETAKNEVQVWNTAQQKVEKTFQADVADTSGRALAFSPDGKYLAAASSFYEFTLFVWNIETGNAIKTLPLVRSSQVGKGYMSWIGFSPDSSTVYFLGCGHSASTAVEICDRFDLNGWNTTSGDHTTQLQYASGKSIANPAMMFAKHMLVIGYDDGKVILHDMQSGKVINVLSYAGDSISAVAGSENGSLFATVDVKDQLQLWDTATGASKAKIGINPDHEVRILTFSPDNTLLASRGAPGDMTIQFLDASNGHSIGSLKVTETGLVYALTFSPDGTLFATNGSDGMVRIWSVAAGN